MDGCSSYTRSAVVGCGILSVAVQRIIGDAILRVRGSDLFSAAGVVTEPPLELLLESH